MHPSPIFNHDDKDDALAFIAAHPFAMLAVNAKNGPVSALVPLVLDVSGEYLLGHVARNNPFWHAVQASKAPIIAVFRGGDAYVSASSYPSKKTDGRVVPTWNYIAVQVRGAALVETDAGAILPFINALTDAMEAGRDAPWRVSDAPQEYTDKLSQAIIGFRLAVDEITYVRKASQNKSAADRQGVMDMLAASGSLQERLFAAAMKDDHTEKDK